MESLEALFRTAEYHISQIQTEHQALSMKNRQYHAALALQWLKGLQGATTQIKTYISSKSITHQIIDINSTLEKLVYTMKELEQYFHNIKDATKEGHSSHIAADISITDINNLFRNMRDLLE